MGEEQNKKQKRPRRTDRMRDRECDCVVPDGRRARARERELFMTAKGRMQSRQQNRNKKEREHAGQDAMRRPVEGSRRGEPSKWIQAHEQRWTEMTKRRSSRRYDEEGSPSRSRIMKVSSRSHLRVHVHIPRSQLSERQ